MKTYTQMKSIQNFNKKALRGALVAAGMAMASTGVSAATSSGNMTTNATLTSSCSVSASTLAFGNIAALDVTADVTADTGTTLKIACSQGTTTPLIYSTTARTISGPSTTTGSVTTTPTLAFNLSQTTGAATDTLAKTAAGETIGSSWTANGAAQAVTIYGRIPTASFKGKAVGTYTGTIVISVEYS